MLYFIILLIALQLFELYVLYRIESKIKENVNKVVLQIEEKPTKPRTRLSKNKEFKKNVKAIKEDK